MHLTSEHTSRKALLAEGPPSYLLNRWLSLKRVKGHGALPHLALGKSLPEVEDYSEEGAIISIIIMAIPYSVTPWTRRRCE